MKKRQYINEEPIYSHENKKIIGCNIFGENTNVHLLERMQGSCKYNGSGDNKIIFTITFEDSALICTSKVKDTSHLDNEGLYATYALDLMEDHTYEEYYKAALLITKNRLKRTMNSFEEAEKAYTKTGFWDWPYNTDPKMYRRSYNLEKMVYESIDITEKDLKYISNYKS
jgi:hypothetical protein